jgi:hypothetical protein
VNAYVDLNKGRLTPAGTARAENPFLQVELAKIS